MTPQQPRWILSGIIDDSSKAAAIEVSRSPFRIGRRPDLELSLNSRVVSAQHAELTESAGLLAIKDLGSTNGTFVNGRRTGDRTLLAHGDLIEIGNLHLRVDCLDDQNSDSVETTENFGKTRYVSEDDSQITQALAELMSTRALEPCFQPIHVTAGQDVYGYEYLARSSLSAVSQPAQMFQAAEAMGRSVELSALCREMAVEHSVCLPRNLPLFLNTHPDEDLHTGVVEQMRELSRVSNNRQLVLEIHEKAMTDPEMVRELRQILNSFNVKLALDDFGAGQARIRELFTASADYVKFDAAMLRDAQDASDTMFALFRQFINYVSDSGTITVAEGVETEELIQLCGELGFDLLQGYALSRPTILQS